MYDISSDTPYSATAVAHANIAIAKYWGKRNEQLNLPFFDSVAFGVEALETQTTAVWNDEMPCDALFIDDWQVPEHRMDRMRRMIDVVRERMGWNKKCQIRSRNHFTHSAGLASSASGSAAAALAVSSAAGLSLSPTELSILARLGSGSAARSIHSGWTRWHAGKNPDGSDSYATRIAPANYWPLNVFVVLVSTAHKEVSSTEGMRRCIQSPFWDAYEKEASQAAEIVQTAVIQRDFGALTNAAHHNAMLLHALAMSCPEPVCYFAPKTIEIIQKIFRMCSAIPVCCTIDAGANVIVLCEDIACPFVKNEIMSLHVPFIQTTIGGGTALVKSNIYTDQTVPSQRSIESG